MQGGDSNLYGYVLGDPVNFVDVLGLSSFFYEVEMQVRKNQMDYANAKKDLFFDVGVYIGLPRNYMGKITDKFDAFSVVYNVVAGVAGTKVANAYNNRDITTEKNFYKGKLGSLRDFLKKGGRYPLTAVERALPAIVAVSAFEFGEIAGSYLKAYYQVLTK